MIGILGLILLYGTAWLLSRNRGAVSPRIVLWGLALQLAFALIVMRTGPGIVVFQAIAAGVTELLEFAEAGSDFVFGPLANQEEFGFVLAFQVLPVVIFIASFFSVLYYLGLMQRVVLIMARGMRRTMKVSGAESLAAAANVFMGQTEAPIIVAPYVPSMTMSELMALMTGGFATVSGAILATYIAIGIQAEYLLAASVMAAPASLVMAKLLMPETGQPETTGDIDVDVDSEDVNVIDAAARGAGQGVTLALNIGGMLIAFLALIELINGVLALVGGAFAGPRTMLNLTGAGIGLWVAWWLLWRPERDRAVRSAAVVIALLVVGWVTFAVRGPAPLPLRLEAILGTLFAPVAFMMGVPWAEAGLVGELFGTKLVLNEVVAYLRMSEMLEAGQLSPKSELIASYALCGFANFSSVAIQIGGIGGLAPSRKSDLARIGMWAVFAGMMASYTVATLAGMIADLPA